MKRGVARLGGRSPDLKDKPLRISLSRRIALRHKSRLRASHGRLNLFTAKVQGRSFFRLGPVIMRTYIGLSEWSDPFLDTTRYLEQSQSAS